jgi:hypothetical protein
MLPFALHGYRTSVHTLTGATPFSLVYGGPYVVKRAFSGGALLLTTMDGEDFTRLVNSDAVKKYFA